MPSSSWGKFHFLPHSGAVRLSCSSLADMVLGSRNNRHGTLVERQIADEQCRVAEETP